jgi:F-type H+-transporting ATPase subunit gamma
MSQRREVEARLALYDDLSGILAAMRSFAVAELHRVTKREAAQQQVVQSLTLSLDDLAGSLLIQAEKQSENPRKDIWLVIGSVRGFCGSFNEDVIRLWRGESHQTGPVMLVGERLHGLVFDECVSVQKISGANGGLDAPVTIERILAAIELLQGNEEFGLMACIRDEQAARCQRLWPLSACSRRKEHLLPFTYSPLTEVASGVAQQFLFHSLLALLLRSIRVENHMRLMQMETALRHLERGGEELQRQRNRLRQEEIVEEIELMVGRR